MPAELPPIGAKRRPRKGLFVFGLLSIVAAVSLTLFLIIEFRSANPLLNLRLFARRNFAFGILANTMLGIALYGSAFVLPIYLARIQGYNSEQIGMVLAWTGIPQLLLIPLVPRVMKLVDVRLLIAVGFALFAASNFMNVYMTGDYAADQLFWPNVIRAVGQALVFAPLSVVATAGIERENAGSASALFNMMRNLGGAVGIASLQTFLTKREQFHSNILSNSVSLFEEATRTRIAKLTAYFMNHGVSDQATWRRRANATTLARAASSERPALAAMSPSPARAPQLVETASPSARRNTATASRRWRAWSSSDPAAAVACSTSAAFCCVT